MPTVKKKKIQWHNLRYFRKAPKYLNFLVIATPSLQDIKGYSLTAPYCTNYFLQWKFQKGVYHA